MIRQIRIKTVMSVYYLTLRGCILFNKVYWTALTLFNTAMVLIKYGFHIISRLV